MKLKTYCIAFLFPSLFFFSCVARVTHADDLDPFDRLFNGSNSSDNAEDVIPESDKSSEELVADASALLQDEKPFEGRTKLLSALKKDPKNYRAMMLLSGYYMQTVGHFKLALRYVLQAIEVFEEKEGKPPYEHYMARAEHQHLMYLLSQARLNLDDYQGALDALDEYTSYGYFDDWYPGSRSWILMKLGRLDEAVKIARLAAVSGVEQGRILNMLGILLSMKNERMQSLAVFKEAISYELSLGKQGQPGTPLNNSAEVLKELFEDNKAVAAWQKTLRLPDGCEHVLPALNLALISIEGGKYKQAEAGIRSFEECNAQFPLRNGEEHRALVALARGRILLRTGYPVRAMALFEEAQRSRQWFGKIGTDEEDMQAGTLQSLSQALAAQSNWLRATPTDSLYQKIANQAEAYTLSLRSWWLRRKAANLLGGKMLDFEDFEVRFTDSLLEYSTLGDVVSAFPPAAVQKKVGLVGEIDTRSDATSYYLAYQAASELAYGQKDSAIDLYRRAAASLRETHDVALLNQIRTALLPLLVPRSSAYRNAALELYRSNPAWLKNAGLSLPIAIAGLDTDKRNTLESAGFIVDPESAVTVTGFSDGTYRMQDGESAAGLKGKVITAKNIVELSEKAFRKED